MVGNLIGFGGAITVGLGLVVAVTEPTQATTTAYRANIELTATALMMGGANGGGTIGDGTMLAVLDGKYAADTRICVSWPAEIAPIYGTTTLGRSIAIGADNLAAEIRAQYANDPGTPIVAVGLSQASEVLDATMTRLAAARAAGDMTAPPPDKMSFVVAGDSDRGVLGWFKGITLPVFDYTPQGTPETPYNVTVVKGEYDGFADPPDRWWNLIAMFNAAAGTGFFAGFGSVHYDALWVNLDDVPAQNITTTTNSLGAVTTTYLVPTADLPMLRPLKNMGVSQDVIDGLEKVLKPIIDSAYIRNDPHGTGSTGQPGAPAASVTSAASKAAATSARAKAAAAKPAAPGSDSSGTAKRAGKAGSKRTAHRSNSEN